MAQITRITMFDFDGTLFRSDDHPPAWWKVPGEFSWGIDSRSLDEPCVPARPGAMYWNSHVVAAARDSSRNQNDYCVLITGRIAKHERRIKELLGQVGIRPDGMYFNPGMSASAFKKKVFSALVVSHPYVDSLAIWENENEEVYRAWVERVSDTLGREIRLEVNPVHEVQIPASCGPEDFQARMAARVAARYVR